MADTQYRLFADGRFAVLIVLQARDAAGKDGTIRHVFSGVNPCGLYVVSFKQPSQLELAHDFLWRTTAQLPARGTVAIFNRSYYEDVLVVRVHPEYLAAQKLAEPPSPAFWAARLRAIADHERYLAEQGTVILKFWLNVSKAEQRKQLLERIDEPPRTGSSTRRPRRARALGRLSRRLRAALCARRRGRGRRGTPCPADNKHYLRWQVAKLVNDALDELSVEPPRLDKTQQAELEKARKRLLAQGD